MIIKSLSRSSKSFERLYNYLTREKEFVLHSHNLYANPYDKKSVVQEFMENSHHINQAQGKNYLYHEIIAFNHNTLSPKLQEKILLDLAQKYLSLRACDHLAFSSLHRDKEHPHIHLMISANEVMGHRRIRLSKKEFATIQKELEQYVNEVYPELGKTEHYQQKKSLEKSKNKEQESKRRSKKPTQKERVKQELQTLFEKSITQTSFKNHLTRGGLEIYQRGQTLGVIFEGKKYRLKTLGIEKEYFDCLKKLEQKEQREEKRQEQKESKKANFNQKETTIDKRRKEMEELRKEQAKEQGLDRERSK